MRLAVMGLMAVIGLSQVVFAGDEWAIADVAKSGAINEDGYYVYLKKAEDKWSVVGFSTLKEDLVFGEIKALFEKREKPTLVSKLAGFLDKHDGYERLIVDDLNKKFYLSPNYLSNEIPMETLRVSLAPMPKQLDSNVCIVGLNATRTARGWPDKQYTFCTSKFTKCENTGANKLRMGVWGIVGLGALTKCNTVIDASQISNIPMADFETQRLAWSQFLNDYESKKKATEQTEEKARQSQRAIDVEKYRQEALNLEKRNRQLFEKGQAAIANNQVGEMICFNGTMRNHYETITVSAFIEDVKNKKVKVRINSMNGSSGSIINGDVPIDGIVYRNGDTIWASTQQWRACSL